MNKTKKRTPDQTLFQEREALYQEALKLLEERKKFTKQRVGKDELRTKKVVSTIAQLQKRIKWMEKNVKKCKEEEKAKVLQQGIKERQERIEILQEDLDFLKNNDVPLFAKRKMKWFEILEEVYNAAEILDLKKYLYRKPAALSGGQRQRVALGRTIVRHPKVFLMDEPLSNLDAKLRVQTRSEISKIHKRVGATTVYVTHDQTEAMTMADRIVIMKDGYIQQIGTPEEVFSDPVNVFVAGFIGNPPTNFVNAKFEKGMLRFGKNCCISLKESDEKLLEGYEGKEIILGIRPENIYLAKDETIKSKTETFKFTCDFVE